MPVKVMISIDVCVENAWEIQESLARIPISPPLREGEDNSACVWGVRATRVFITSEEDMVEIVMNVHDDDTHAFSQFIARIVEMGHGVKVTYVFA